MPGRCSWLTCAIFPLAVLLALPAGEAQAHSMDAQAFVLKDRKVRVEAWFPSGGPARGARVQVLRPDGQLLTEGKTNEVGIFVFSFDEVQSLQIVISDGAGHRKDLSLSKQHLAQPISSPSGDRPTLQTEEPDKPVILANRDSSLPTKDIVIGISFLLAVAAFFLSVRNARRLRELMNPRK